jgi:hypothetical protein
VGLVEVRASWRTPRLNKKTKKKEDDSYVFVHCNNVEKS